MGPISNSELGRFFCLLFRTFDTLRFLLGRISASLASWSSSKLSSLHVARLFRLVVTFALVDATFEAGTLANRLPAMVESQLEQMRHVRLTVVVSILHWSARLLRRVVPFGASWDSTTRKVEGSGTSASCNILLSTSSRPRILLRTPLSDQRRTATLNLHGIIARTGNLVVALLMHWCRWTRAIPADRLRSIEPDEES